MGATTTTTTEDRALQLLGSGVLPATVASALGVTESRISQLLSDPNFADSVAQLRFENLQKHNKRDNELDNLEDELIEKFKASMALMFRPEQILRALQVINAAKRRGQAAPEAITQQQNIITLVMPTQIVQKFTTNINNQVVQTGDQKLVTVQSGALLDKLKNAGAVKELTNGSQRQLPDLSGIPEKEIPRSRQEASGGYSFADPISTL
jgi:hypothetical protein